MEDKAAISILHEDDEDEIPRYDVISDFCKDYISLQPSKLPSTSYHGSDFAKDYNADMSVENEFWVVDSSQNVISHKDIKWFEGYISISIRIIISFKHNTLLKQILNFIFKI